jgi:beta-galactosidase
MENTFMPRKSVIYFAMLISLSVPISAQVPSTPYSASLLLGAAWYPEQWPESRWEADLSLMEAAHIHVVRVGEFAWSSLEPREDDYQLDWLDRAVRAAERHHVAVVLGTPSAAPPAWLTAKYPETLRIFPDGRKDQHGNRTQFDWSNPKYRELAAGIATKLAVRFGHDPNVVGWQICNEYGNESFGAETKAQFQQWLRAKYKTLESLNARWTTTYWSESYQDWAQIPIQEGYGNPGLLLNWKEFVSDTWRSYQRNQLDAIRAHADPRQKITTNMMGWFDAYDHYTVAQDLDFASWDNYVGTGHLNPVDAGARHDLTRGFLRKNFWVMETQPGMVNWSPNNNMLDKGETRAMAWNDIGHGADAVLFWQWRSALNGQEEYHGTLVGADGTPVPVYEEAKQIGSEFEKAAPALAGTTVDSQVAILHDYESRWAINWQRHNSAFDPVNALVSYYAPLRALARSVDVVADTAPLSRYKLVVAPALNVLTPEAAKNLEAYVRGGGHLVLTQRSAMKDEDNSLYPQRQPGPLAELLGARVEQWYSLDKPVPIDGEWGAGENRMWAEQLSVSSPETRTLMRYGKSNGWLDGQPAAVTRPVGQGSITYIGAGLEGATMKAATEWMMKEAGIRPIMSDLPEDVDLAVRSGNGKQVFIFTNYGVSPHTIPLAGPMEDVLMGGTVSSITLPQYGVAVLR